jgi:Holliday junction DNA helicase RuvA
MIGYLQGILISKQPPQLIVNVNGVGYEVQASLNTFFQLPEIGKEVFLFTHLSIREDAHILFGFIKDHERQLFRNLIKVNNVGPKSALTILSGIEPDNFVRCILENDTATLSRLPGIGKKTAERLVIEMRDRVQDWNPIHLTTPQVISANETSVAIDDAISALVALGYKYPDARRAVLKIDSKDLSREHLIRLALQSML